MRLNCEIVPRTSIWMSRSPEQSSAARPFPASSSSCATLPRLCPVPRAARCTRLGRKRRSRKRLLQRNRRQAVKSDVPVGDLGSGSDYTAFFQHLGVPSSDVSSSGPYGVYHSTFDDFAWFKKFGDPDFVYEQQMARVFGLEAVRMADADVLPYDYEEYGKEVVAYLGAAKRRADDKFGNHKLDFEAVNNAAHHFESAGTKILAKQKNPPADASRLNQALLGTERALLVPQGLPHRPWFRHAIYAPGEYTGYAAVVIPGVNEAIDKGDSERVRQQLAILSAALERAAKTMEGYR